MNEPSNSKRQQAAALLDEVSTRGQIRRVAAMIEGENDAELVNALVEEGRYRGAVLPPEAHQWPVKKLLRRARGLMAEAVKRSNPIACDEAFCCIVCGKDVPKHGRTARNHCPFCLHSRHVDITPGDRQSDCGGVLKPVSVLRKGDEFRISFRCEVCGMVGANRSLLDGECPDSWDVLIELSKGDS